LAVHPTLPEFFFTFPSFYICLFVSGCFGSDTFCVAFCPAGFCFYGSSPRSGVPRSAFAATVFFLSLHPTFVLSRNGHRPWLLFPPLWRRGSFRVFCPPGSCYWWTRTARPPVLPWFLLRASCFPWISFFSVIFFCFLLLGPPAVLPSTLWETLILFAYPPSLSSARVSWILFLFVFSLHALFLRTKPFPRGPQHQTSDNLFLPFSSFLFRFSGLPLGRRYPFFLPEFISDGPL